MAKKHRRGLLRKADFTEDTVGIVIDSFLSLAVFPRRGFSLEPFSSAKERWLGADGRLYHSVTGFAPFYMQFKRPSAYPAESRSRIVTERAQHDPPLPTKPEVLFFELRKKAPTQADYQHNILYRLRQRLRRFTKSDAAYVCPLFLRRDAYRLSMHLAGLRMCVQFWRRFPWTLKEIVIADRPTRVPFEQIPIFAEHVTIPPHRLVEDAKHKYSFTDQGTDVCFHSPEHIPDGSTQLAKWLSELSERFIRKDAVILREHAKSVLEKFLKEKDDDGGNIPCPSYIHEIDDGIEAWMRWGSYLANEFDIHQYAFMHWNTSG